MREEGEIIGAVVTFKDITDRLAVERMKDEFISVVSHELRTPMTSIHGALGLLNSGLLDAQPHKGKRMLEIAVTNTDRLVRLINDILDLERMESSYSTAIKQTCNVADLMLQAVDEMQGMAQQAGVTLSVTPVEAQVRAVRDRLIQTLTNLLSNAIKFSPSGATVWLNGELTQKEDLAQKAGLKSVSSSLLSPDSPTAHPHLPVISSILIAVKDQGRGIPEDKLEMVFERFQQVDASDSRQKGGTGLGLAICRSIVQQHGGQIWVESVLGEGSTFFLSLPVLREGLVELLP
jgi:signal transduction histidine kinase